MKFGYMRGIISIFIAIAMFIPLSQGGIYVDDILLNRDRGPPKTSWYEVEDWEVTFCMKWGGTNDVIESGTGSLADEASEIAYNRIVTIQAERDSIVPSIGTEQIISAGVSVFEVAWFVQPFTTDEDISYEVWLEGSHGQAELVDSGNTNYYNPARGYHAVESEANYTKARLKYWNEDFNKVLEVPIV